jgi:hypothetical protein
MLGQEDFFLLIILDNDGTPSLPVLSTLAQLAPTTSSSTRRYSSARCSLEAMDPDRTRRRPGGSLIRYS